MLTDACGVKGQDKVMVILPRLPEWWLINIACLRTGLSGSTIIIHSTTDTKQEEGGGGEESGQL